MTPPTIFRLAEEILKWISGAGIPTATNTSINEIKISIAQVANQLLKTDYLQVNVRMGETIPNGSMVATYSGILVIPYNGRSICTLPIKPIKLPRNMGVFAITPENDPTNEFIPVQMGQFNLIKSQPLLNDLLGQVGYEVYGDKVIFTRDITDPSVDTKVDMRLVIMDISQYGDYDILPILPEMEWQIKNEVIRLYGGQPMPDKTVDPSVQNQKNVPIQKQQQA